MFFLLLARETWPIIFRSRSTAQCDTRATSVPRILASILDRSKKRRDRQPRIGRGLKGAVSASAGMHVVRRIIVLSCGKIGTGRAPRGYNPFPLCFRETFLFFSFFFTYRSCYQPIKVRYIDKENRCSRVSSSNNGVLAVFVVSARSVEISL